MCSGDCYLPETTVEQSLVHILMTVGSTKDVSNTLIPFLEMNPKWADCLDKKQVILTKIWQLYIFMKAAAYEHSYLSRTDWL